MPSNPASLDMADVFSHSCLHGDGTPRSVITWATQQKLPELAASDARRALVADGPDGRAWFIRGPATNMLLAVRAAPGVCAVYGEHVDGADFLRVYDLYLPYFALPGSHVDRRPDHVAAGAFGEETQRFATIRGPGRKLLYFIVSANQKPGGPYQAKIMISKTEPKTP